jgi:hypothetical protein
VTIEVYSILGQRVATLFEGFADPGRFSVTWNASVASGVYVYRLQADPVDVTDGQTRFLQTRTMVLIR